MYLIEKEEHMMDLTIMGMMSFYNWMAKLSPMRYFLRQEQQL